MRIDHLKIRNFKGIDYREHKFHPNFNLIVGVNGTGKTSTLDAISVAIGSWLLGMRGHDTRHIWASEIFLAAKSYGGEIRFEEQYPVEVTASGEMMGQSLSWARSVDVPKGKTRFAKASNVKAVAADADKRVRGGEEVTLPLISYYGTGRLWLEPKASSQVRDVSSLSNQKGLSRLEAYKNSVDPRLSPRDLARWIARQSWIGYQQGDESGVFSAVKAAIIACVEGAKNIYFDPARGEVVVVMHGSGARPFFNLSDGQRSMVAMIGDIAQKAATLNPHLGRLVLEETPGVVLIDELDLHLHPRWQRRLIEDIRKTFPKIQFICTTHSPFLIQSLRSGEELLMLEGQPTSQLANKSLEQIAEGIMGVPQVETADRYTRMVNDAKEFMRDLESSDEHPALKMERFRMRLAESSDMYADNPAYQAFLELQLEKKAAKGGVE